MVVPCLPDVVASLGIQPTTMRMGERRPHRNPPRQGSQHQPEGKGSSALLHRGIFPPKGAAVDHGFVGGSRDASAKKAPWRWTHCGGHPSVPIYGSRPRPSEPQTIRVMDSITARLAVLSAAVQAIANALPNGTAQQVAVSLIALANQLPSTGLQADPDAAMAGELAAHLKALERATRSGPDSACACCARAGNSDHDE